MNSQRFDLIIIGGGLTGCALGLAIGQTGLKVAIVERAPIGTLISIGFDGRVTAIARGSKRMLERIGAWQALEGASEPIRDIEVDEGNGFARVHYDHRDVGGEPLGWIAENRDIRSAILRGIESHPNVRLESPAEVAAIDQDDRAVTIELSDGGQLSAPILALADGRHSALRSKVGIDTNRIDYDQSGLVATFRHDEPHHGLAVERFFADGPFAMLPMMDQRSSLVWALERQAANHLASLSDRDFTHEVEARFGPDRGRLTLQGPRWCYPLSLVVAQSIAEGRIVLVGDSAHGIHPIAGQGWNLALRDVAVLSEIIFERARLGLDPGDGCAIAEYRRRRRADSALLIAVTDGINRLFANDIGPVRLARQVGLTLVDQAPAIKRLLMLHAMGLVGDLPNLMRP